MSNETTTQWAPDRIWLQRDAEDGTSHTWCQHSQDGYEQAEYARIGSTTRITGLTDDEIVNAARTECIPFPWGTDATKEIFLRAVRAVIARNARKKPHEMVYCGGSPELPVLSFDEASSMRSDEAGMPMLAAAYPQHGEPGALEQGDAS